MSGFRWQFSNKKAGVLIHIHDPQSADHLKFVLQAFFPDYKDWEVKKIQVTQEVDVSAEAPKLELSKPTSEVTPPVSAAVPAPVAPLTPPSSLPSAPVMSTVASDVTLPGIMKPEAGTQAGLSIKEIATPPAAKPPAPAVPIQAVPLAPPSAPSPLPPLPADVEDIQEESLSERRKHERFDLKFRVIFTCENVTYRTYTSDISRGGMRLQQKMPTNFLNKMCKVFIGHPNRAENIEMTCKVVLDDPKNSKRITFVDCPRAVLETLSVWMLDQRKKIGKAA